MDAVVAVVSVESVQNGDVWSIFNDFIDPFYALDHFVAEKET